MKKKVRIIPGFGLSMGVTLSLLSLVVLIPLASLVVFTAKMDLSSIIEVITKPRVVASFKVSLLTALIASLVNAVMGVVLAWVLVRYDFPLKRLLDGMIELPFALPTAVAGISLTSLYADTGLMGKFFAKFGIKVAYTRLGIIVALIFVGIPFVVRAVQPVLEKLDPLYEEAAGILGASRAQIFRKVIFPELRPRDLHRLRSCIPDAASVNTAAWFSSQETSLSRRRSLPSSSCRSFRNSTIQARQRSLL